MRKSVLIKHTRPSGSFAISRLIVPRLFPMLQVKVFRAALELPLSPPMIHTDAHGLKNLFTYMIRRHDGSVRTDPWTDFIQWE